MPPVWMSECRRLEGGVRLELGLNVEELWRSASLNPLFCGLDGCRGGLLADTGLSLERESLLLGGAGADLRGSESKRFLNSSESFTVLAT